MSSWPPVEEGFRLIFDGKNLDQWAMIGLGEFVQEPDLSLRSEGGMGLLWYTPEDFSDFVLCVDFKMEAPHSNSGVFVRFPEPRGDPWNPVNEGHEIQIMDTAEDPMAQTGAVYSFAPATHIATKPAGEWNTMQIQCMGPQYTVSVNGEAVCDYRSDRALKGYVGIQNHNEGDHVWFRNIRIRTLQ